MIENKNGFNVRIRPFSVAELCAYYTSRRNFTIFLYYVRLHNYYIYNTIYQSSKSHVIKMNSLYSIKAGNDTCEML